MKKAIIGLAAFGAVIGLRPLVKRVGHKAREHCEQMAVRCKEMMAGQPEAGGEAARMPEPCKQMAAQHEERREPVATV